MAVSGPKKERRVAARKRTPKNPVTSLRAAVPCNKHAVQKKLTGPKTENRGWLHALYLRPGILGKDLRPTSEQKQKTKRTYKKKTDNRGGFGRIRVQKGVGVSRAHPKRPPMQAPPTSEPFLLTFKQFFAVRPQKILLDVGAKFVARTFTLPHNVCVILLQDPVTASALCEKLDGVCKKQLTALAVTEDNLHHQDTQRVLKMAAGMLATHGEIPTHTAALLLFAQLQAWVLRSAVTYSTAGQTENEDQGTEIQRLHDTLARKQDTIAELRRQVFRLVTMRARPAEQSADAWAQLQDEVARLRVEVEAIKRTCDSKIEEAELELVYKNEELVRTEGALLAREQEVATLQQHADRQSADIDNKNEQIDILLQASGKTPKQSKANSFGFCKKMC